MSEWYREWKKASDKIAEQTEQITELVADNEQKNDKILEARKEIHDLIDERNHLAESLVQANLDIIRLEKNKEELKDTIDHLQNQLLEEREFGEEWAKQPVKEANDDIHITYDQ